MANGDIRYWMVELTQTDKTGKVVKSQKVRISIVDPERDVEVGEGLHDRDVMWHANLLTRGGKYTAKMLGECDVDEKGVVTFKGEAGKLAPLPREFATTGVIDSMVAQATAGGLTDAPSPEP